LFHGESLKSKVVLVLFLLVFNLSELLGVSVLLVEMVGPSIRVPFALLHYFTDGKGKGKGKAVPLQAWTGP
jgi:hypothetical protein